MDRSPAELLHRRVVEMVATGGMGAKAKVWLVLPQAVVAVVRCAPAPQQEMEGMEVVDL